jgi:hypothetical protein
MGEPPDTGTPTDRKKAFHEIGGPPFILSSLNLKSVFQI